MRPLPHPFLWILVLLIAVGCDKPKEEASAAPSTPEPTAVDTSKPLDHAQPKLQTVKLWLGSIELETEVAIRPVEIMTGMMFRKEMADTEGMIFVLPGAPRRANFYMKNTTVPLSCAYIDMDGKILEIHDLTPLDENPVESATDQIAFVLEVPKGWFQRKKIEVGALVRTDRGTLRQTFYRKVP